MTLLQQGTTARPFQLQVANHKDLPSNMQPAADRRVCLDRVLISTSTLERVVKSWTDALMEIAKRQKESSASHQRLASALILQTRTVSPRFQIK